MVETSEMRWRGNNQRWSHGTIEVEAAQNEERLGGGVAM